MPTSPRASETPVQTIKRLQTALEDEKLRNLLLNEVVDILDKEYGAGLRKKLAAKERDARQVSLSRACSLLGVSRQSIYQREQRQRQRENELAPVRQMVIELRRFMPRLGGLKLYFLLKPKLIEHGIKLGRDAFFDYLRKYDLLVPVKRSYTKTTDSKHWMKKHPNLLKGKQVSKPEEVFVSDITYVESDEGIHYLSLVTDASSRMIMGHELSWTMKASDCVKALKQAMSHRQSTQSLIHHSDRGSQYCSELYQKELRRLVTESIEIYNELRPHLNMDMQTPISVNRKASSKAELAQ